MFQQYAVEWQRAWEHSFLQEEQRARDMRFQTRIDIGIASVGWAVLDKERETVIEAGSNIFPEASAADNQLRRDMRGRQISNRLTLVSFHMLIYSTLFHCQSKVSEMRSLYFLLTVA